MPRYLSILGLLPLAACDQIVDTYEGLTAPLVAQGMILGVEAPSSPDVDLSSSKYSEGSNLLLFLATAEEAAQLENAPVTDGDVTLSGASIGEVPADNVGDGTYLAGPDPDLIYTPGETWRISATVEDDVGQADMALPEGVDVTIPEDHAPNTAIMVDLTGQGFTSALIVVIDVMNGTTTYTNEPTTIREMYDAARANDPLTLVEIPASAFAAESVYGVGIAGLNHTKAEDLDFFNTALSAVHAGKLQWYPVYTAQMPPM